MRNTQIYLGLEIGKGGKRKRASSVSIGSDLSIYKHKQTKQGWLIGKEVNREAIEWNGESLTGSWRSGFVSSFAGLKGGFVIFFTSPFPFLLDSSPPSIAFLLLRPTIVSKSQTKSLFSCFYLPEFMIFTTSNMSSELKPKILKV